MRWIFAVTGRGWRNMRLTWLVVCMLLVSACSLPESSTVFESQFDRAGRFVVRVQAPGKPAESVQGGFKWRQNASDWQLDLVSPLGATLARIDSGPEAVVLYRPSEPPQRAASAATLLAQLFGAQVPVDAMPYWIVGKVAPGLDVRHIERDEQDRITVLNQQGWTVTFERFDPIGPRAITVQGMDLGLDVQLRMIVDGVVSAQ